MSKRRIDLETSEEKHARHSSVIDLDGAAHGNSWSDTSPDVNPLTGLVFSKKYRDILKKRKELPCWEARQKFLHHVHDNQVVLIVGATGSGKTTQLPQFILEAGYAEHGLIACTQPRRVAAM